MQLHPIPPPWVPDSQRFHAATGRSATSRSGPCATSATIVLLLAKVGHVNGGYTRRGVLSGVAGTAYKAGMRCRRKSVVVRRSCEKFDLLLPACGSENQPRRGLLRMLCWNPVELPTANPRSLLLVLLNAHCTASSAMGLRIEGERGRVLRPRSQMGGMKELSMRDKIGL